MNLGGLGFWGWLFFVVQILNCNGQQQYVADLMDEIPVTVATIWDVG